MKRKLFKFALCTMALLCVGTNAWATPTVVGYTETINGSNLDARVLSNGELEHLSISSSAFFGSAITDQGSKTVYIDNTAYTNNKSWRKSVNDSYDNQFVGYTLNVGTGYKLNISNVNARIAVADDTYTWYVEILNSIGTQVWKSSEKTTTKASSGKIDNVDVSAVEDIQGLTGDVTVKLWVKQGGSTKYFSINYLQLSVELVEDSRPIYTITASVAEGQSSYGSINKAGANFVAEGESISLTATGNQSSGYWFVNWTDGNGDEVSTEETLILTNVTADATYMANFKQVVQVKYNSNYRGTIGNSGSAKIFVTYNAANGINELYANANDIYTIPAYAHKYFYREGYRFNKWAPTGDGKNRLDSGDEYNVTNATITENKITLNPSFTANTKTLAAALGSLTSETTVSWPLGVSNIVFRNWETTDAYGYYTQATNLDGEVFDIPMTITSNGKIANYTRTDAMCQTNQNVKFTLPAVKGMVVTISGAYAAFKAAEKTATTVAGSTDYTLSNSDKTLTYTYTGEASTIDIVMGDDAQYITTISVTYPRITRTITLNSSGYATYSNDHDVEISGAKAYTAELDFATPKITCHEITSNKIPAGNGVLLYGDAGATVTLSYTTGAEALSNNNLKATTDSEGNLASKTEGHDYYALSGDTFKTLTGDFVHHKAYFEVSTGVVQARSMRIAFAGDITGVANVEAAEAAVKDGKFIENGKLVIVKNGKKFNSAGAQVK